MSTFNQENQGNYTILYPGLVFEYSDNVVTIAFEDDFGDGEKPQLHLTKDEESKTILEHLIQTIDMANNEQGGALLFIKTFTGLTDFEKLFVVLLDEIYAGTKLKIYQHLIDIRDSYQS